MASWNSYAPLWWQSQFLPLNDENEQPYLAGENRINDFAPHRPAPAQNAAPASLLGNIANLPVALPFDNFSSRSLYPMLGSPGTAPWTDPQPATLLSGINPGLSRPHPVDGFNDTDASPAQIQWLPPLVRPFTGGGLELFARPPVKPPVPVPQRVKPPVPDMPPGMTRPALGDILRWGSGMQAKDWAGRLKNEPELGTQIISELKGAGVTKDLIRELSNFYRQNSQKWNAAKGEGKPIGKSDAEQFGHRSDGLQHLYDQWPAETPSTTPTLPLYLNSYGPWCPDPTQCT